MDDIGTITGSTWGLVRLSMGGEDVTLTEQAPTLRLESGRAGGFGGVNRWFADYEATGNGLRFDAPGSTMMAGPQAAMALERAFFSTLDRVDAWRLAGDTLELWSGSTTVAWFRRLPEAVDGAWDLRAMNDGAHAVTSLPAEVTVTAEFRDGTVTGSSGCNRYRAAYEVTGERLHITPAVTTRRLCSPEVMTIENRFLACLGEVTRFEVIDGDSLHCYSADGARLLQFRRALSPPSEGDAREAD